MFKYCGLFSLLVLAGCQNTPTFKGNNLQQQLTHSYCYQYMYGSVSSGIDYGKAFQWCGKSILQSNAKGMALMGEIYFSGLGQTKDLAKAYYWYQEAAKLDHAHGQYMLYYMHKNGLGVSLSAEKAQQWLQKSLDNGHPVALLEHRQLLDSDVKKAAKTADVSVQTKQLSKAPLSSGSQ